MLETRDDLRDDVMALLAAGRELGPEADADLATVFRDRLQNHPSRRLSPSYWQIYRRAASMAFVGVVWLAAVAILVLIPYDYYLHDSDVQSGYYSHVVPSVLTVAIALTVMVCLVNLSGWRLPHVRIIVHPAREDA